MDTAVALVQAYLHVNGYFTVAEYPILESVGGHEIRTVTDLDILAWRFPRAGHDFVGPKAPLSFDEADRGVDPALGCAADLADMIVGEVKEGTPRVNSAMRDPAVLAVALARFGCCPEAGSEALTHRLLRRGRAVTPAGHTVRVVAFGDTHNHASVGPWHTVPMDHVVRYLQAYLHEHWAVLRHAQLRDPAFAVLALLEKWGVRET